MPSVEVLIRRATFQLKHKQYQTAIKLLQDAANVLENTKKRNLKLKLLQLTCDAYEGAGRLVDALSVAKELCRHSKALKNSMRLTELLVRMRYHKEAERALATTKGKSHGFVAWKERISKELEDRRGEGKSLADLDLSVIDRVFRLNGKSSALFQACRAFSHLIPYHYRLVIRSDKLVLLARIWKCPNVTMVGRDFQSINYVASLEHVQYLRIQGVYDKETVKVKDKQVLEVRGCNHLRLQIRGINKLILYHNLRVDWSRQHQEGLHSIEHLNLEDNPSEEYLLKQHFPRLRTLRLGSFYSEDDFVLLDFFRNHANILRHLIISGDACEEVWQMIVLSGVLQNLIYFEVEKHFEMLQSSWNQILSQLSKAKVIKAEGLSIVETETEAETEDSMSGTSSDWSSDDSQEETEPEDSEDTEDSSSISSSENFSSEETSSSSDETSSSSESEKSWSTSDAQNDL